MSTTYYTRFQDGTPHMDVLADSWDEAIKVVHDAGFLVLETKNVTVCLERGEYAGRMRPTLTIVKHPVQSDSDTVQ